MKLNLLLCVLGVMVVTGCGRSPEARARRGLAALDAGQAEEAGLLLAEAVEGREADPAAAALWGALGLAQARAGRMEVAEESFRTASRLAPEDFWIHLNYGALLIGEQRFTESLGPLSVAVRADLFRTEALELMARSALRLEDAELARRLLEEAAQRANDPRVLTSLATLAESAEQTRSRLQEALDLDPAYGPAALNLAILLDRNGGEVSQALHFYERYLSVTPAGGVDPAVRLRVEQLKRVRNGGGTGEVDPEEAQVRSFLERSRAAVRGGDKVLGLNLATRAAQLARRSGRADLEERALRLGVEAAPGQARAHGALGQFLLGKERVEESLAAFREAVRLAPEAFPALMGLGRAAIAAGDTAAARGALEQAEGVAASAAALTEIEALYRDVLRDRRSARRVERARAERFPE